MNQAGLAWEKKYLDTKGFAVFPTLAKLNPLRVISSMYSKVYGSFWLDGKMVCPVPFPMFMIFQWEISDLACC